MEASSQWVLDASRLHSRRKFFKIVGQKFTEYLKVFLVIIEVNINIGGNMKTVLTIRIDEEEKKILQAIAEKEDMTISQLVRKAIREYYFKEDK